MSGLNLIPEMKKLEISPAPSLAQQLIKAEEDTTIKFDIIKVVGNTFVKQEKLPEALAKYEEAWPLCRNDEDRAMILNNKGVVFEKMGQSEKAMELFTKALQLNPKYVKALIRRAMLHRKENRIEDAFEDVTEAGALIAKYSLRVAGLEESTEQILIEYGEKEIDERMATHRMSNFPKGFVIRQFFRGFYADPVSRMWKRLDPSPLDEYGDTKPELSGFLAALDCLEKENYPDMFDHCSQEIDKDSPESESKFRVEAFLLRGSLHFLCGQKEEAAADFQAVIDDPSTSNELKSCAYLKAAICANLWKTSEETAELFSHAEKLWKENGDVYYHAAICLIDRNESLPALALLEKGMEVCNSPKKFPMLHVLGLTLRLSYDACMDKSVDATNILKQLEADGIFDTPECYEYYGQCLFLVDPSGDQAFEQFDKSVELSSGDKMFILKRVLAGHIFKNDPEATIKLLMEHADDLDVGHVAWYHIGELKLLMGKKEEGFEAMDKSIALSTSLYDIRIRVMGKVDLLYNVTIGEKLKKYGFELRPDGTVKEHKPEEEQEAAEPEPAPVD